MAANNVNNPFTAANQDISGQASYTRTPAALTNLSATGGPDLQATLTDLRNTLQQKSQEVSGLGTDGQRITQNLVLIRNRIMRLAGLFDLLFTRLANLETTLQGSFNETLQNIAQDIGLIRAQGMAGIVGEIAAINTELSTIQANTVARPAGQMYGNPNQPLHPSEFDQMPQIDAQGVQNAAPPAPQGVLPPGQPPGFYGGGKKKKGGYTYPKMRSRSRLRSHPRVTHKFNTIKPKKHTRRHRKHKKSSKKHHKH